MIQAHTPGCGWALELGAAQGQAGATCRQRVQSAVTTMGVGEEGREQTGQSTASLLYNFHCTRMSALTSGLCSYGKKTYRDPSVFLKTQGIPLLGYLENQRISTI